MKKTYLVANWKANKTTAEAISWVDTVAQSLPELSSSLEIIICVPLMHLDLIHQQLPTFQTGAQNLSPYPDGAYTGEVSARILKGLVSYALVGHSERRHYFHENSRDVALKITQALEQEITPIIAVSQANWHEQLNLLQSEEIRQSLIMYEPPEAISQQVGPIGAGEAAPLDEVVAAIKEIKKSAPTSPVLYGGSVKSHNISEFLSSEIIDGVVPGSASLNAEEWLQILKSSQHLRG